MTDSPAPSPVAPGPVGCRCGKSECIVCFPFDYSGALEPSAPAPSGEEEVRPWNPEIPADWPRGIALSADQEFGKVTVWAIQNAVSNYCRHAPNGRRGCECDDIVHELLPVLRASLAVTTASLHQRLRQAEEKAKLGERGYWTTRLEQRERDVALLREFASRYEHAGTGGPDVRETAILRCANWLASQPLITETAP